MPLSLALLSFRIRTSITLLIATALLLLVFAACVRAQAVDSSAGRWEPMAGSAKPEAGPEGEVRFKCAFSGHNIERASWDLPVQLDLTGGAGLTFEMRCKDPSPIGAFTLYFQSGGGWYRGSIGAPGTQWGRVELRKEQTSVEERPAGWAKISALRLSAWRGGQEDAEFEVRAVRAVESHAGILLIRGESGAVSSPQEIGTVCQYAGEMAEMLRDLHLSYSLISDLDVTAQRLQACKLAILPHNPAMPQNVSALVAEYMNAGGKVISFYELPPAIAAAGGVTIGEYRPRKRSGEFAAIAVNPAILPGAPVQVKQLSWNIRQVGPADDAAKVAATWLDDAGKPSVPAIVASPKLISMTHVMTQDDPQGKRKLLLAMVGRLVPDAWAESARGAANEIGRIGQCEDWSGFQDRFGELPAASPFVKIAAECRARALAMIDLGKYVEAMDACQQGQNAVTKAFCAAQQPAEGEQRAFWCHRADGVEGMNWEQAIKCLSDNGFNAIIPNMMWGGVAFYPSKVLPVAPMVAEKGDQVAQCLAACRKYGVKMHVWKVNWNMGWATPAEFVAQMKAAGRVQKSFDGRVNERWLCPSHPANQQLEIDSMVEVATQYDIDGIHFDYIRYPGPEGCFCAGCRERFEKAIGMPVKKWPADTRRDAAIQAKWLDFRRQNITKVVAAVAEKVHRQRPGVKISAAVFPNWTLDRDGVGQDWKLWCDKGYLDFVCPMDYTPFNEQFDLYVRQQKQWAGKVPMYPGIGLSTWPGGQRDTVKLIEQIQIARKYATGGFTIFEYNTPEATDVVPLCGLGVTRR